MNKLELLHKVKELYNNGDNIISYLKNINRQKENSFEDIMISYDFQAGSYIREYYKNKKYNQNYGKAIADIINNLGESNSILEIGVGEGTTLKSVLDNINKTPTFISGFDISWSRVKFAKHFLCDNNYTVNLFTANLFDIPFLDNSIDIVYTSHSLEPNGGKEEEGLKELYRIANKYLILLEPSYEFSSDEAKKRMDEHGYIKNLSIVAQNLGYNVIENRLFDYSINSLNPTGLIIIEKNNLINDVKPQLHCPITHIKLEKYKESFLSTVDGYITYPVLENIPCILKENAILTTNLLTDYRQFKAEYDLQ